MICFMCQELPKKWSAFADYGVIVMEQREDRESGKYTLCPKCYEKVKGLIWRRYTIDAMREMQAEDTAGGAARGELAAAAAEDDGSGGAVGDAGVPRVRGSDTGLYIQEG